MGTTDNCLHNPICVKPKTRKKQQYLGIHMCNKITIRPTPLKKIQETRHQIQIGTSDGREGGRTGKQYFAIGIIRY